MHTYMHTMRGRTSADVELDTMSLKATVTTDTSVRRAVDATSSKGRVPAVMERKYRVHVVVSQKGWSWKIWRKMRACE